MPWASVTTSMSTPDIIWRERERGGRKGGRVNKNASRHML